MTQRMEMKHMTLDEEAPKHRYGLIREEFLMDGERRITYGIAVYELLNETESFGTENFEVVALIRDITPSRTAMETLIRQCNEGELSLIHLADVVDDLLGE